MKTFFILSAASAFLLAACDKGRQVEMPRGSEPMNSGEPLPLPGDVTRDHWAPPSSGKTEGLVPDPITGTPNQDPTPTRK